MKTIKDNSQLERHHDVVLCKKCPNKYPVEVKIGQRNSTQCPKCNHAQGYVFK